MKISRMAVLVLSITPGILLTACDNSNKGALNPETGAAWEASEVDDTKNTDELGDLGLSNEEVDAIAAFLKTLTDERYEHLIP